MNSFSTKRNQANEIQTFTVNKANNRVSKSKITIANMLFLFVALLTTGIVNAQTKFKTDNGIYYTITDEAKKTVSVSPQNDADPYWTNKPTGEISIPKTVTNESKTYTVTEIADNAFSGCKGITSVKIEAEITEIGESAFYTCSGLKTITLNESLTTIKGLAFAFCSSLESFYIPKNLTSMKIDENIFRECNALKSIDVDAKNTAYASEDGILFSNDKKNLLVYPANKDGKMYIMPNTIEDIQMYAFGNCQNLKVVKISDGMTSLKTTYFTDCPALTTIIIPKTLTAIEEAFVFSCSAITQIVILQPDASKITVADFSLIDFDPTMMGKAAKLYIPKGSLVSYEANTKLSVFNEKEEIKIEAETEKSIDTENSFTLQPTVVTPTEISSLIKYESTKTDIATVDENGKVTALDKEGSTDINILIGGITYATCKVTVAKPSVGETKFKVDGIYYKVTDTDNNIVEVTPELDEANSDDEWWTSTNAPTGDITIPKTVTYESQTYTVKKIGDNAFNPCPKITSVKIDADITEIGEYAFYYCSEIKKITLSESLTTIKDRAFSNCSKLESISIPKKVTTMATDAGLFADCTSLTSIDVDAENTTYSSEDGVLFSKDKKKLFLYPANKDGETYMMPNTIEDMEMYAFEKSQKLTVVKISDAITSLKTTYFTDCPVLTTIILPKTLTAIEKGFTSFCLTIKQIIVLQPDDSKITIADDVFDEFNPAYGTNVLLYVPKGKAESYKANDKWSFFTKKEIKIETETEKSIDTESTFTLKPTVTPAEVSSLVKYESTNTDIAIVDENGKVTALDKDGSTDINILIEGIIYATCKVTVNKPTGINDNLSDKINIYPTLVNSSFTIRGNSSKPFIVNIFNTNGKKVKTETITSNKQVINVDDLTSGFYLVKTQNATMKFIKK